MSGRKSLVLLFIIVCLTVILLAQFMGQPVADPAAAPPPNAQAEQSETAGSLKPAETRTKLRADVSMRASEFDILQQMNRAFEQGHPGFSVSLNNLDEDQAYADFKAEASSGAADIFLMPNEWINEFAASGYLSNLTDEWFTSDVRSREFAPALKQIKWNGYLWGIPRDVDAYVLVWNKNAFAADKGGQPPRSPAELLELNKKPLLPEPQGFQGNLYLDPQDPLAFVSLLWSLGGAWPNDAAEEGGDAAVTPAELLDAFYFPNAPTGKDQAPADRKLADYPFVSADYDPWTLLEQGQLPCLIATAGDYLKHRSVALGVRFLAPVTVDISFAGAVLTGSSYGVSAYTDQPKAALEWIQAIDTMENQLVFLKETSTLPALSPAYDLTADSLGGFFPALENALSKSGVLPAQPEWNGELARLREPVRSFYGGELTADQLDAALRKLTADQSAGS